jgi:hypothetical protein
MRRWRKTIDIKPFIHKDQENTSPEHVVWVARQIAATVRKNTSEDEQTWRLLDIVETLEDIDSSDDEALVVLNSSLSDLYDWADDECVWLGIMSS